MIYMFLANGFEEVEALCPLDLLRRAGLSVRTVAVGHCVENMITGGHGITVQANIHEKDFCDQTPEMIILPGGLDGVNNLDASPLLDAVIYNTIACGGYVAAICAAPTLLGKRGYLRDREAICYPGMEDEMKCARVSSQKVVRDGSFITAAGVGAAFDFALKLIEIMVGEEAVQKLRRQILLD